MSGAGEAPVVTADGGAAGPSRSGPAAALTLPATLSVFGAPARAVTVTVLQQSGQRRAGRALAALGMFWGLAVVAVFLPVVHFVLVPSLLAAGVIVAALRLREHRRVLGVEGACPRCGVVQVFTAAGRLRRDQTLDCPRCHSTLTLAVAPSGGEV